MPSTFFDLDLKRLRWEPAKKGQGWLDSLRRDRSFTCGRDSKLGTPPPPSPKEGGVHFAGDQKANPGSGEGNEKGPARQHASQRKPPIQNSN